MNNRYICIYDFETDGKDPKVCSPVQLAAMVVEPRKLLPIKGGEFHSHIQPMNFGDADYLDKHRDTVEWHAKQKGCSVDDVLALWAKAPPAKTVWTSFTEFTLKFHTRQSNRGSYTAPVPAGYNINNFDRVLVERLCQAFGPKDTKGKSKIFSIVNKLDLYDMMFSWFENLAEPTSLSMDSMREFLGLSQQSKAKSHDALQDVRDTYNILYRFLMFQRNQASVDKFKNSFSQTK